MKIKTSELTERAIDWVVTQFGGAPEIGQPDGTPYEVEWLLMHEVGDFNYSTDGAQGGPIIEREKISTRFNCKQGNTWEAYIWTPTQHDLSDMDCNEYTAFGQTALIAAMRCYILSVLGGQVEVPDELC